MVRPSIRCWASRSRLRSWWRACSTTSGTRWSTPASSPRCTGCCGTGPPAPPVSGCWPRPASPSSSGSFPWEETMIARGPLSEEVIAVLRRPAGSVRPSGPVDDADPFGDDLQLALHLCYELHYQGLPEVGPAWEWDPDLLRLRGSLERVFENALHAAVAGGGDVTAEIDELLVEHVPGSGLSHFLRDDG